MLFSDKDSCVIVSLFANSDLYGESTASDDGYTDTRHDDES